MNKQNRNRRVLPRLLGYDYHRLARVDRASPAKVILHHTR